MYINVCVHVGTYICIGEIDLEHASLHPPFRSNKEKVKKDLLTNISKPTLMIFKP